MAVCTKTTTGNNPLFDGIIASVPAVHLARGVEAAGQVLSVDDAAWVMFDGMSNFRQETQATLRMIKAAGIRHILFHNACRGAWDLRRMVVDANTHWSLVKAGLAKRGITPQQVRVLFIKNSVKGGTTPDAYGFLMESHIERAVQELPNLQQIFISSAVYSGYSSKVVTRSEPGAWLEGTAVNNTIGKLSTRFDLPWIGWGPYLWADGERPRWDGLVWKCWDFELDGIHPGPLAEAKVAEMFIRFLNTSPLTGWYKE